jgi:hypothetical protein
MIYTETDSRRRPYVPNKAILAKINTEVPAPLRNIKQPSE